MILRQLSTDAIGCGDGLRYAGVGHEDDKFLAAVPCRYVRFAGAFLKNLTEEAEGGVAGRMAMIAVEVAEMVDIEHDRGQVGWRSAAFVSGDREDQGCVEMPPVVQAGQAVEDRESRDFLDEMGVRECECRMCAEQGEHRECVKRLTRPFELRARRRPVV